MIIVAIIAITLSIAVPNYLTISKISKRTVCINNIKKILGAVEQYVIENNISVGTALSSTQEDEVYSKYLRGGVPVCPSGGEYTIETIGSNPQVSCSKEEDGHTL
jgi:Tfp pilus assembly protein PilE